MIAANNPFNIRFNKRNNWIGQTGQKRGFCEFDTINHGVRAAFVLIKGYIERDIDTPRQIITRFAPPKENDTVSYIDFVCHNALGDEILKADGEINTYQDLFYLLSRMAYFESKTGFAPSQIAELCKFDYSKGSMATIKLF